MSKKSVSVVVVLRRYNYYITHGIDTEHIAPLDRSWIGRVLDLLAPRLRQDKDELITCLVDEMRDDYLLSVKKAIIDFVLPDPRSEIAVMVSLTIHFDLPRLLLYAMRSVIGNVRKKF